MYQWSVVFLCLMPVNAFADTAIRVSQPDRATIYRDRGGYAVLEESIPPATTAVRLPAGTDLSSVRVLHRGKRVDLHIEQLMVKETKTEKRLVGQVIVERTIETQKMVGHLLRFKPASEELRLRYGTSGIGWRPHLDADLIDHQQAHIALTALVNNSALDLRNCRIQLASAAGPMPSKIYFNAPVHFGAVTVAVNQRAGDVVYDAGAHSIGKGRSSLLTLLSSNVRYERKLIWRTDNRDRVRVVLMMPNPFPVPVCVAPASLTRNGALLGSDATEWTPPGAELVLAAGYSTSLEVKRTVETTEDLRNKPRPFRHAIEFSVANRGNESVHLEVLMRKHVGSRHKTLYDFQRQPDGRPGQLYLWKLELDPGDDETIALAFQSEHARFTAYEIYDSAQYAH